MTEHRKLKKLVRDRMATTGESYTTARRHVLARAARPATLPAGLVPGYRTFGAERHRTSALLAHALEAHGVVAPHTGAPYTEAMIAGLAGGIGFMYFVFEYRDTPPLMTIVAQHHPQPWVPAVLDRLAIPFTEQHSTKPALALEKVRAALTAGRPVFATVDQSRLPWHGREPGFGTDAYVVAVAGIHDDTLAIDDEALHAMPAEDFATAWSAHRKGRHHMLTIDSAGPDVDLGSAIRDALATTVAHLTGPVLGNNFDVNFGFSGMEKLSAALRDTRKKTGWPARFGSPVAFAHGVRRLYECLELEHTAPGATRPVYADFLDEATPLVDARLGEAAALFRESGQQWSALATLALDTTGALGEYADVAEQRLALMFARGPQATAEIQQLTKRLDTLADEYAADDPLGDAGRRELFSAMADIVDTCLHLERQAVTVLSAVV
jgi:Butirosin biosynthesis protein H, N-terminal/Domain of unknown function (DUF4872)